MQGSLDEPPIVLRGDRGRGALVVMGSVVFVALGIGMWSSQGASSSSAFAIGFFGLCGLAGLAMLVAPPRLEIGPGGLTQRVLWRTSNFAWADVYNFRPMTIGLTTKMVGFDYLNPPRKRAGLRNLNTALGGSQGALQSGWEIAPGELADLLNRARERWLAASGLAEQHGVAAPTPPSVIAALGGSRINRKTYWIATVAVFAVVIGLSFVGVQRAVASVTTIIFARLFASRLHDFGRSGWWQLILYGLQISIGLALAIPAQSADVALGAVVLIQLLFTIVLGVIPGNRADNRFGPPPGAPTPAAASEVFR